MLLPSTLGELRKAVREGRVAHRSVRRELRENLIDKLRRREPLFPGILGYEDTVVPQVVNAILSEHSFILLGLRGQAKTRLIRSLVTLLDDAVPVVPGSDGAIEDVEEAKRIALATRSLAKGFARISNPPC